MLIRPVYDILLLPDVSYYFKKDFFAGWGSDALETGEEILFLQLKEEKPDHAYGPEDFYPIGISARVEGISEGENIQVRTLERVDVSDLEFQDGLVTASAAVVV